MSYHNRSSSAEITGKSAIFRSGDQGQEDRIKNAVKEAETVLQKASPLQREITPRMQTPPEQLKENGNYTVEQKPPKQLDLFLEEVFQKCPIDVSVKTRIGMESGEEFIQLMEIYNKYPIKELIIHPRTQKDFYKNTPQMDVFEEALGMGKNPICYNGDITAVKQVEAFSEQFPEVERIMIGRGVLADPALARKMKGGPGADKEEMRCFHDLLYAAYCEEMSGERTVLYKMKELWFYLGASFTNSKPYMKKIKKAEKCVVYERIIDDLFRNEDVK